MLILLLLDVHRAQVLGEQLFYLTDSLFHRLELDCPLFVQLEGLRVVLKVGSLGATWGLVAGKHVKE